MAPLKGLVVGFPGHLAGFVSPEPWPEFTFYQRLNLPIRVATMVRGNPTRILAEWIHALSIDSIPSSVVDRVGYLLLDLLGVEIYGLRLESSVVARRFAEKWGGTGPATVLGSSATTQPSIAALVNGITAHGPELDDVMEEASLHPAVVNLSALLSIAEDERLKGFDSRRFIEATVASYEVMVRIGTAVNIPRHYARGFHPTGTAGSFGAAAGVAKYLGQDASTIQNAMGLAGSQAAGSLAYLQNGSWAKRFNAGWAAHSGIVAALMAASGLTGPDDILAGRNGFFQAYTDEPLLRHLTEGLGKDWAIERVAIKPYGCCRYSHSAIDAALALRKQGLRTDQISAMRILMSKPALMLVGEPEAPKRSPDTSVDAQFSVYYAILVALVEGHADAEDFADPKTFVRRHPEIESLRASISPECDELFPQHWATRLIVKTKEGRHMEQFVMDPKGSPEKPLTWDELITRFRHLSSALSSSAQDDLVALCRSFEKNTVHPYSLLRGRNLVIPRK